MATHGRTGWKHLVVGSVAEAVIAQSSVPVLLTCARPGEMPPQPPFDAAHTRVVVPLDGSKFAEAALPAAIELLGLTGELVLVTVVEPPHGVVRDEYRRIRVYLDQQEEALTRQAREYLHTTAAQLIDTHPGLHVTSEARVGAPAAGVIAAAADRAADLVVMSSHGRTGIRRAVFGSVTGAVVHDGNTPVMVVHPRAADTDASATLSQHVASFS